MSDPPFVMREAISVLRADIRRRSRELQKLIRETHQEVRKRVSTADSSPRSVKVKSPVNEEIKDGVVLVGYESSPELPGMPPPDPRDRVRKAERVVHKIGGPIAVETEGHAALKHKLGRTSRLVWRDADAKSTGSG